ncbi:alpha/beta hydrolase family protein [Parasphingorhabdus halotolerans]|uniref:Alpha/beta hydrolase family protein n=1 Tax=Parasphingorhabdus halotolerans TaxID=2725558 RepID=A0A6H2DLP7_9SPHN|nr:hypothetical protein [Parasphingorhabdus halotolerans]QJB69310.1 hypothetical protein HF685_08465 [Parasphingorhabdus halotolerans]
MKKVLWNGLLFVASLYLGMLVIVYLFQNSFLYIPDQEVPSSAQLARTDFTAVTITSEGESKTTSLWKPPTDQTRPVFMHLHGNAGSHYHRIPLYRALAQNGSGVLGVGYPGYGGTLAAPAKKDYI